MASVEKTKKIEKIEKDTLKNTKDLFGSITTYKTFIEAGLAKHVMLSDAYARYQKQFDSYKGVKFDPKTADLAGIFKDGIQLQEELKVLIAKERECLKLAQLNIDVKDNTKLAEDLHTQIFLKQSAIAKLSIKQDKLEKTMPAEEITKARTYALCVVNTSKAKNEITVLENKLRGYVDASYKSAVDNISKRESNYETKVLIEQNKNTMAKLALEKIFTNNAELARFKADKSPEKEVVEPIVEEVATTEDEGR